MSRHEGVSCDSCLKSNFRGRRYKCLICYDYDLCANCYTEGATSTRHSTEHPMQCILTRSDFDLYYGGESITQEQPQSFTCPYCGHMGFTEASLFSHVTADHTDTGLEVVCPICAALPGGDPNLVTDDFAGHLSLEHRTGSRDLISFLDEPSAIRHGGVRRIPHSGRALGGPRSRRSNMHFSSSGGGLSNLSPSGRETVDPIAELLQQLSGVRRGAPQPSQLQQLQMQIQLERQQVSAARQQLERLPRRQAHPSAIPSASNGANSINIQSSGVSSMNGNVRDGTIAASPMPLNAAAAVGSGAAIATTNASSGGASSEETFQPITPLLWDELEKLTEEQQKEREKVHLRKIALTVSEVYQALQLKDPIRYMRGEEESQSREREEEQKDSISSVSDKGADSSSSGGDRATAQDPTSESDTPLDGIVNEIEGLSLDSNHANEEASENLSASKKPGKSHKSTQSSTKPQVKSAPLNQESTDSR